MRPSSLRPALAAGGGQSPGPGRSGKTVTVSALADLVVAGAQAERPRGPDDGRRQVVDAAVAADELAVEPGAAASAGATCSPGGAGWRSRTDRPAGP